MAITPNMNLTLPDVSVTAGPTYATQINAAVTTIDTHDHTTGNGKPVPTSGLNINSDLEFNSNSASELKSVKFDSQSTLLTGTNLAQVKSGDLYFNDSSGNQIRITAAGAINVAGSGGFGGDYISAGATAIFTNATDLYTFRNESAADADLKFKGLETSGSFKWTTANLAGNLTITNTDGNLIILVDTSSARTITLPDPTLGKRLIIIKDKTGSAATNNITLARNGAETIDGVAASKLLTQNLGSWWIISDNTNWYVLQEQIDRTSVTVFDSSTVAGTDSLPSAYASPTLSAAAITEGTPVSMAANNLTFPFTGKYQLESYVMLSSYGGGGGNSIAAVRMRNTTDSTTSGIISCAAGAPAVLDGSIVFNVSDIAKIHQIQWATDRATAGTVGTNNTVVGETTVRWRFIITKVRDS